MRSDMPWMEPRSPWTRFAPTALALAIIGIGIGGAVRIVRAQDSAPVTPPAPVAPAAPQTAAPAAETDTLTIQQSDQDSKPGDADRQKLEKELQSLEGQRARLDNRIASLRSQLGVRTSLRIYRSDGNSFYVAPQTSRPLTEEEKKRLDEAQKEYNRALRTYQDVLKSLPPGARGNVFLFGDRLNFAPQALPAMPTPPAVTIPQPYEFQWNGNAADMKAWAQKSQDYDRQMKDFNTRMQAWEKEFRARMEKWQQEFESQMHRQFDGNKPGDKTENEPIPVPQGPSIEPPDQANHGSASLYAPDPPATADGRPRHAYSSHDAL